MILNRHKNKEKKEMKTVSYAPGTGVKNAGIGWNARSHENRRFRWKMSYTTCFDG